MKRNLDGLSMLELLICMAIFTTVATGVMSVNALPRRAALNLEDKMAASLALERKINELRGQAVSSLSDGVFHPLGVKYFNSTSASLEYEIKTPDLSRPDWKEVYLSISWTDRGGQSKKQEAVSSLYDG